MTAILCLKAQMLNYYCMTKSYFVSSCGVFSLFDIIEGSPGSMELNCIVVLFKVEKRVRKPQKCLYVPEM